MILTMLTPALQERIVASLRAGGYPTIAAQAWGVPPRVFRVWLRRGESAHPLEPYRGFAIAVREAIAQARLRAEMTIFESQPRLWLQNGPGRETADTPGWTTAVKPTPKRDGSDALSLAAFRKIAAGISKTLGPYPEASAAVADWLATGPERLL